MQDINTADGEISVITGRENLNAAMATKPKEQDSLSSANLYRIYHSLPWTAHLVSCSDSKSVGLATCSSDDEVLGLLPVHCKTYKHNSILNRWTSFNAERQVVQITGEPPKCFQSEKNSEQLFHKLFSAFPDASGIYVKSIQHETRFSNLLNQMALRRRKPFTIVCTNGLRQFHGITLPSTFEEYLQKFKPKTRQTYRRKVRLIEKRLGAPAQLCPVTSESDVDQLMQAISSIQKNTASFHEGIGLLEYSDDIKGQLKSLARHGLVMSFFLKSGTKYLAYVLGISDGNVFHYSDIAFDYSYTQHSPGNVLLYLIIEYLITEKKIRNVNFGIGDSDYKRQFGNMVTLDQDFLVMKKGPKNLVLGNLIRVENIARNVNKRLRNRS